MGILNKFKSKVNTLRKEKKDNKSNIVVDNNDNNVIKRNYNCSSNLENDYVVFSIDKIRKRKIIHDSNQREKLFHEINDKLNKINSK
ncbi:MAG: hypothetical protein ACFE85_03395 [Candidatus Hodarchaeota archaeon]